VKEFQLGARKVGLDHPPLVVPEVGINHEGSYEKAVQLVDAAAEAGAEIVKFQCHITEEEMIPTDMKPGEISEERLWDIIKRCELTDEEELRLKDYTENKGMIYLSTPFSRAAADRLEEMDVAAYKIGSGECNNFPLIEHIAGFGKPMIVSTGMNELQSIRKTVEIMSKRGTPFALLHCTSMYPTPYGKVRLGGIASLQEAFREIPVGLSDHSMGVWTCLGAVSLGACILEKHFTISRDWPGPDTGISIEPNELCDLIVGSSAIWQARGGTKDILAEEKPVIDFAYASVVAIRQIKVGETLSLENIWVKRPGTGPLLADQFDALLGKTAARDIASDVQLVPDDIA
jgi:sialic acid synthase SpsE